MSYIQRSVDQTPFCTATISGSDAIPADDPFISTTAFDTTTANWAVFDSSTKDIETSVDTLAFCAFSPNNTTSGGSFYAFNSAPNTTQLLRGMIRGESDAFSAGGTTRGDDVSFRVDDTVRFQYSFITSGLSETPDTARSVMYMMTIGE